ncbi:MAG: GIY-YIG nuclease family protein [Rhodothermales bacterium]
MDSKRKAELRQAYKEAVPRSGVLKIHSAATGQTWIDTAANVDAIKNRIWFTLRMGNHPNKSLQQAWNESGPDAMLYEVIEVFKEDVSGYELERLMKERKQHWMDALQAESLNK